MSHPHTGRRRRWAALPRIIARRAAIAVPTVILISVAVYALAAVSPMDPLDGYLSGQSASLTEQQRAELRHQLGLDLPWWQAWLRWGSAAITGDWGQSLAYHQSVSSVMGDRLGWTILLAATGLALAIVVAGLLAIPAALREGGALDRAISALAATLQAVPPFVAGLALIALFAVTLRWLPTGGLTDPGGAITFEAVARHLVLPAIVFGLSQSPWLILGLRESLVQALTQESVGAARLRGVSRARIVTHHVVPGALAPFVALVATRLPELVAGSVIVEAVFAWPGVGAATVEAASRVDLALLSFICVTTTLVVLASALFADLVYVLLDPRVETDV